MVVLLSPDQGMRVGAGCRGSTEKLMSSTLETWKELTREKELSTKDAHVSETRGLQLLPRKWEEVQGDQGTGRPWEERDRWGLREGLQTTIPLSRI